MSNDDILKQIIDLFYNISDAEEITAESELLEDLGVSSMDVLMMLCLLEEKFSIKVPEKMIRRMTTIGDVADTIEYLIRSKD